MHLQNNTLLQGSKYKIERFIASGGFGCTYEAHHTLLDERVALKEFFVSDFCNRDERTGQVTVGTQSKVALYGKLKKKFMDEARALYKMKHAGIVRVTDVFEENGTAYYAMEYIDGQSLSDVVKKRGKLPEAEAVVYIRQVAEALKYVHSLNRLHLDIKPGNIMLGKDGKAVLIDFGASKHYDDETGENTSTLLGINTKGYAPVEQVNQSFKSFSPATDIYALGATLYKLLTGITPPPSILLHSEEATLAPLPSTVSPSTRKAVESAMQLLRKNRPQTIDAWMQMLSSAASNVNDRHSGHDEQTVMAEVTEVSAPQHKQTSGTLNGYDWVDLGLSVKWATQNVGASSPSDYGGYFAWGETRTKSIYDWDNCFDCLVRPRRSWGIYKLLPWLKRDRGLDSTSINWGIYKDKVSARFRSLGDNRVKSWGIYKIDGKTSISPTSGHDTARENWGGSWRMPTDAEFEELCKKCEWTWTSQGGHKGYKVTGPNGNSIFLPAAGDRYGPFTYDVGEIGNYWSRSLSSSYSSQACQLYFNSDDHSTEESNRGEGRSVRPVTE